MTPIINCIHKAFKIKRGFMTTIHSATNDQKILDLPHKDLRRARSAIQSMIITSTGAAKAVGLVITDLKGKLTGISVRVPLPTVSLVDLSLDVSKTVTPEQVNNALRKCAKAQPDIIEVEEKPLVSKDFQKNPHSAIVDALSTMVIDGNMVKIMAWYDNEWGYSNRLVDLAEYVTKK
jgi:glyceraldehyde 3-phosphate dehydrogenase